jgi:hypothetical protein
METLESGIDRYGKQGKRRRRRVSKAGGLEKENERPTFSAVGVAADSAASANPTVVVAPNNTAAAAPQHVVCQLELCSRALLPTVAAAAAAGAIVVISLL